MSNQGYQMTGIKFRIGNYTFRIWKNGFEYGNQFGGTVRFFPWAKP